MALNCPHCSKPVGDYVPKERLDEALTTAKTYKTNALAYEALKPEWDAAQTKLGEVDTLRGEVTALRTEKIETVFSAQGITSPKIRALFQSEFDEQAAAEGGEKDLGAWLGKVKALPEAERPEHLAPFLRTATPAATQTPADPTKPKAPTRPARTVEPVAAPVPGPKLTVQQSATAVAEITARKPPPNATPEQLAAFSAKRREDLAAARAQASAPATT